MILALWVQLPSDVAADRHSYTTDAGTDGWLRRNRPAYEHAIHRAQIWLTPLEVDPTALRARGIKGKKKLVELIDAWIRLYRIAPASQRAGLQAHIDRVAAVTRTEGYHDMLALDDVTFKQDATSYLRAAYLLDQLGLDVAQYREHIVEVHPRLDAHMPQRGAHQRYVFATYYEHFGLAEPFSLRVALSGGLIAQRTPPDRMDRDDVYALTHEIFAPFDYGDQLDADPFDDEDLHYLRSTLPVLVEQWTAVGDVDIVAELVSCLRYVRAVDLPAYTDGLGFLLRSQAEDGHWGDYRADAARIGAWATTYKLELHTTAVALDALTVAFHRPWNDAVPPAAP